tara:strand:+ start:262 stop:2745 length:2484 start_codon:yes stop_codon:yes gene_type:complete
MYVSIITANYVDLDGVQVDVMHEIPLIGGNLKPEQQPPWFQADWLGAIDDTRLQMLRWPGAEASNFFDWTQGTFLPCYKWLGSSEGHPECSTIDRSFCEKPSEQSDVQAVCNDGINDFTAYDIHLREGLVLGKDGDYPDGTPAKRDYKKISNTTQNFASHYVYALSQLHGNLAQPLFVINMLNPSYIDMNIAEYDQDCNVTNLDVSLKNTISQQLDTIATVIDRYEIPEDQVHIQLANEPWISKHGYAREVWPNAEAYVDSCFIVANQIRGHDGLRDVKIGISGDYQANYACTSTNSDPWEDNFRRRWNAEMWVQINAFGSYQWFDAISFHQYGGMSNFVFQKDEYNNISPWYNDDDNSFAPWQAPWQGPWHKINIYDINKNGDDVANEQAEEVAYHFGYLNNPSTDSLTHRDFTIIDNLMYWMIASNDIKNNDNNNESCNSDIASGWSYLTNNSNKEIWLTEYALSLDDAPHTRPWRGTFFHTLYDLYSTLTYMENVPNLSLMITNNMNGVAGDYRLADTFSYVDPNSPDGSQICVYNDNVLADQGEDPGCNDLCVNEYFGLSAKGKVFRLLNNLAINNDSFGRIIFDSNSDISTNQVKKFSDTSIGYEISDIYAWKFEDGSIYDDFLLMNISSESYFVELPQNTIYCSQKLGVDGFNSGEVLDSAYYEKLFYKNYFWTEASSNGININPNPNTGNCTSNIGSPCDDGYDGYYLWEFPISWTPPSLSNLFQHSRSLNSMHGIHSSRQVIEIPRHSIVRLEFCGNENLIGDTNSDGSVNVLDIVMIVSFIVGDLDLTPNQLTSSDFNQDSNVNVLDIVMMVESVLNN